MPERDLGRTTGTSRTLSRDTVTAPNFINRTVTDAPRDTSPSQAYIDDINQKIIANAPKYVAVPWNPYISNQNGVVSPAIPGVMPTTGDPFLTLSDVFRNVFGNSGDASIPRQTGQALVPVTSSSGGSSTFLIIIVLGIAGFAGYYYYKKKSE